MAAIIRSGHDKELEFMRNQVNTSKQDLEEVLKQIDRLSSFIINDIPGEPSRNELSIDSAIRLLKSANDKGIFDIGIGDKLFIYRSKLKVANEYYVANKEEIDKQVAREQLADKIVKEGL